MEKKEVTLKLKVKPKVEIENEFLDLMTLDCKRVWHRYSVEEATELLELVDKYIDYISLTRKEYTSQFYGSALGKLNAIRSVALNVKSKSE